VDSDFVSGVQGGRYESWVLRREELYQSEDPQGTPGAWLDGEMLDPGVLFDASAFARKLGD
jgi:hypothetical protein